MERVRHSEALSSNPVGRTGINQLLEQATCEGEIEYEPGSFATRRAVGLAVVAALSFSTMPVLADTANTTSSTSAATTSTGVTWTVDAGAMSKSGVMAMAFFPNVITIDAATRSRLREQVIPFRFRAQTASFQHQHPQRPRPLRAGVRMTVPPSRLPVS
ncbi:hypothetical protein [Alicyclobacillus sacchari]|uniref:hypothetical protein n=1 Tax=Alicyclobacillus sacchari TaxID=392010 RepID=UPI0024E1007C|nr:hypothetical protein [Alicyclobacillus sacchari]